MPKKRTPGGYRSLRNGVLANATIDRLFGQAHTIIFQGRSYRLKGHITTREIDSAAHNPPIQSSGGVAKIRETALYLIRSDAILCSLSIVSDNAVYHWDTCQTLTP
ncbi:MAG: hypothetical protein ACYDHM_09430 [Acidiferrobacterales bacterium]